MKQPKRRFELHIRIGGDTKDDIKRSLEGILWSFDEGAGVRGNICSGGPSCGYTIELQENTDMNHDKYHKQLKEYLKVRAALGQGG